MPSLLHWIHPLCGRRGRWARIHTAKQNSLLQAMPSLLHWIHALCKEKEYTLKCISVLRGLEQAPSLNVPTPQVSHGVQLVVIPVGLGINLGLLALRPALKQLADKNKRLHYVLVSVHSFETSNEANTVEAKLATRLGWTLFKCGDESNMGIVIRAQASSWEGCKVVLLSHLPKPVPSPAGVADDGGAVSTFFIRMAKPRDLKVGSPRGTHFKFWRPTTPRKNVEWHCFGVSCPPGIVRPKWTPNSGTQMCGTSHSALHSPETQDQIRSPISGRRS